MNETYHLPDLAYDYGALEPHLSGKVMQLHHGRHHAAYVKGANQALDRLAAARAGEDFASLTMLQKDLAFHLSGHVLHSLFWTNLTPNGGGDPEGDLADELDATFGSVDVFRKHMSQAAYTIQGSGWALAAWEPVAGRVVVQQVYDHQGNHGQGTVPLLAIDAWEHAYYLQYLNAKGDFFDAVWRVVNWTDVAERLAAARLVQA